MAIARRSMQTIALRLPPGSDLRRDLEAIARQEAIGAGVIIGAVGSLSTACLRFAGRENPTDLPGKHEILTLSGTLGSRGVHLHAMLANGQGDCKGGHVVYGCEVYTTLELAIALLPDVTFYRTLDPATGYLELDIRDEV